MAMKPALSLRLGQQLRMTPQLQQAIRLLQLSTLDLELEIQEALDSNPMLEELDPADSDQIDSEDGPDAQDKDDRDDREESVDTVDTGADTDLPTADTGPEGSQDDSSDEPPLPDPEIDGDAIRDTSEQVADETIADELPVDSVWDDVYDDGLTSSHQGSQDGDDGYFDDRNSDNVSISTYLMEQVNLLRLSETDEYIALAIVDGLDNEGMLTIDIDDILEGAPHEWELTADEVEAVLHLIQHLDPIGIAARDLRECLLIQLRSLPRTTAYRDEAITVVDQFIPQLANRDYTQIARKTRLKEGQLREVLALILSLNPRPGSDIATGNIEYIEPDVFVSRQKNRWVVELNPRSAPRIRVNPEYVSLIKRSDNSKDNVYLKDNLQEAKWFIKSLQQRNDTLLRVATKIVELQRGFFEYGEQGMKPLVLHDIAREVDLHESTISRVTSQKYMHTPAGVFELKYFFSSHVSTNTGGEVSSTAIRALIKKLVADESPRKPLSDSKIAGLLAKQDIKVARRTIAKYRESLQIPPSNERKQLM